MARLIRAAWATVSSAPWRRAPLLLWRRPGVLATVAGACAVMSAAAAAVPLFVSSVGTAAVSLQAEERCASDTGVTQTFSASATDVRAASADPFAALDDKLAPSNSWARLQLAAVGTADGTTSVPVSLLTRDGAASHIDVVEGATGPGVWITDRAAEATGLGVGDSARFGTAEAPVAAIYRDLSGTTVGPYWCSHADLLLLEVRGGDLIRPPPMLIADRGTFADLLVGLDIGLAEGAWEAALGDQLTVGEADDLVDELACRGSGSAALAWCADGQPLVTVRSGDPRLPRVAARSDADFVERVFDSSLPFVIDRCRAIQTSVGGGIWPVAVFATIAGVGLVAAAAVLWFERRRRELTLLTARGVSPAALGVKAILELSIPLVVGASSGVGLAYLLVRWLGPAPVVEPDALADAAWLAVAALVGAAVTVAVVVGRRVRTHGVVRRRRLPIGAFPWELALVWVTVLSFRRLADWGVPVGRGADVSRVDVLGLLFPMLFIVTGVAVLGRCLVLSVGPLRAVSASWPPSLYLAVRRVARYRIAVIGLVAASAVAAGVLGYSATMNRSLATTLDAKATTFVGSDMAVTLPEGETLPAELEARSTEVRIQPFGWIDVGGERESVTVQGIDPATFARAAFWDPTFSDTSLTDILDRLAGPPTDGAVPAIVVGLDLVGPTEASIDNGVDRRFTIEPVAEVRTFPGVKRGKPTLYVSSDSLKRLDVSGGRAEEWIAGDRDEAVAVLDRANVPFGEVRRTEQVADGSSFRTISWTFGFMQSLGFSAGVLVVGGVAVYLDARRRDRVLGYAFLRRMGLRRGQHRRALALELGAGVLVGSWIGLAIATAAAWVAHGSIDPVPHFRPEPLFRPASSVLLVVAGGAVVLTVVASVLAQRRMDRDDPVEVMRAGA